jgi:tetratricopeptide (TPR) repeat protein
MLRWAAVWSTTSRYLCSLGLLVLLCNVVRAEPPLTATPAQNAYEPLIEEALQAYEAGRYAEARTMFRRAHALNPTSRTSRGIGMCSFNLGDYTDAVYQLEQALIDTRKPLSDEQLAHTRDLISRANARVGRFRLRLTPAEVVLRVDGNPPLILEGNELLVEAGQHEIEARAPGYLMAKSALRVDGGDRTTLVFHLSRDEYAVAETMAAARAAPGAGVTSTEPAEARGDAWVRTLGYASLGVGAASLLGFAVTGALALADENKLQDRCPNEMCSETYRSTVQRYDTMRTLATVTLIAGGALTVLGTTLLIVGPSAQPSERARSKPAVEPIIGLGVVGVKGSL